uniref:B30.2/SPRY domain-containing protein n=1 Tax=Fundulus heteroclitus TaxID=8078 RepID=A0A3Q2QQD4_FUNHE
IDIVFQLLENNIFSFAKEQLMKYQKILRLRLSEDLETWEEFENVFDCKDEEEKSSRELFLKITVEFLRKINQEDLAEHLHKGIVHDHSQTVLQHTNVRRKVQYVFQGTDNQENKSLLNQIYTDLYMTVGGSGQVNQEHEVRQIERASMKRGQPETKIQHENIFKTSHGGKEAIRTVMTKGVAGIGKSVLTQKFALDWAEGKINQDIRLVLPFSFKELNLVKDNKFSLVELIHHFFTETKGIHSFEELKVAFIFDGLDECRLPLDFQNNEILTDVTESTSVDVLLTNLIRGKLLPSAHIWITTRPAAANQIPPECVDMVTEVRGFTDPQKEEYFRKRFADEERASRIVSHIKASRSLHIMCHIPNFCWITATVLDYLLQNGEEGKLPKTLTEMYVQYLVVQIKMKKTKYDSRAQGDSLWDIGSREMVECLGKLAFEQLHKGNLIFNEAEVLECGIDVRAASVYSGVLTQTFTEDRGLYQDKMFCFIHLSVQEFLAALYVHLSFNNAGVDLLGDESEGSWLCFLRNIPEPASFYQRAVDKALKSPNGHMDLFIRFLLGLSLQTNQTHLKGLLSQTTSSQTVNETIAYIKNKISGIISAEESINLFHCLRELNDCSLMEEIQQCLSSGHLSAGKLSAAQWSALVFILLSSEEDLDTFDLKKYSASDEALMWLLPVVKASKKVMLSGCNLSEKSCKALSTVLGLDSSSLTELDLSNNNLQDSGVTILSVGLQSPNCKLESLSLSGCMVAEEGCMSLAYALSANPSHLRRLDLTYNNPGETGMQLLRAALKDPRWKLETLKYGPTKKHFWDLEWDLTSMNKNLKVFENRTVALVKEEQPYPDHPERFSNWQVLCANGLTGRCYWEVDWMGEARVSVSYRGIKRKDGSEYLRFGRNNQSWSLSCSDSGYQVWNDNVRTAVTSQVSHRVAVYVDCPAGILSFYSVFPDSLIHLHTFNTTFTEPLYPGFGFWSHASFVSLCSLKE